MFIFPAFLTHSGGAALVLVKEGIPHTNTLIDLLKYNRFIFMENCIISFQKIFTYKNSATYKK